MAPGDSRALQPQDQPRIASYWPLGQLYERGVQISVGARLNLGHPGWGYSRACWAECEEGSG